MRLRQNGRRVVLTVVLLTATWYVLSGRFDLLHFGAGVIVAIGIAANMPVPDDATRFRPGRFLLYCPWLMVQVIRSNLRVARSVLSPRLDIAPTFVSRRPDVTGDRALTLLGASITLTPGTLTVDIGDHEVFVHALDTQSAQDVEDGIMARRVVDIFEAPAEP